MNATKRITALLALEAALFAVIFFPYWHLRFVASIANVLFFVVLSAATVLTLLWLTKAVAGRVQQVIAAVIAVPAFLAIGGIAMLGLLEWRSGIAGGYDKPLDEIGAGRSVYRAYQMNCGAACNFEISVRREFDLLPGLKLVSPVFSREHAQVAKFEKAENGAIRAVLDQKEKVEIAR